MKTIRDINNLMPWLLMFYGVLVGLVSLFSKDEHQQIVGLIYFGIGYIVIITTPKENQ